MSTFEIVRAWKDAEYRQSLSVEARVLLPEHPAGSIELANEDLRQVAGGTDVTEHPSCQTCDFVYCFPVTIGSLCDLTILQP